MSWQQLLIHCNSSQSNVISDLMTDSGSASITLQDAGDKPIFEPPPGTEPIWPELIITGLFTADKNLQPIIDKIQSQVNDSLAFKIEIVEDKDWIREWMDSYQPICFGNRLWICPSWCEPPEPDAVTIMLDPGLAFGTLLHHLFGLFFKTVSVYPFEMEGGFKDDRTPTRFKGCFSRPVQFAV